MTGDKDRIESAAREIVRRLGGNVLAALVAVGFMAASSEQRSKAGKNSAASRRAKMANSKERVLVLAQKIRGDDQELVQTELATAIAEKKDPELAVGYDRVLTFISELEAEGRLPRAQPRKKGAGNM
jgi:hypothetical protein